MTQAQAQQQAPARAVPATLMGVGAVALTVALFTLALVVNELFFSQTGIVPRLARVPVFVLALEAIVSGLAGLAIYAVAFLATLRGRVTEAQRQAGVAFEEVDDLRGQIRTLRNQLAALPSTEDLRDLRTQLGNVPTAEQLVALEEQLTERINRVQGALVNHTNLPHGS